MNILSPDDTPPDASPNEAPSEVELVLPHDLAGLRLDVAISKQLPQLSRTYAARLLKSGDILIENKPAKASYTVRGGENVSVDLPEPEIIEARPENIPLNIVFEDRDVIVINKPPGMVAHPSSGHNSGSLVNALLYHCKDLSSINGRLRPGIVHRLDKDTSGVIIAAKNDTSHRSLADQFAARTVKKQYLAICYGAPIYDEFFCDGRIGRHRTRRTEMTVLRDSEEGREAYTDFKVLERFPKAGIFVVKAMPRTGRTHQIRVHLAKSGYPILSDPLYGKEASLPEYGLQRHALHAQRLSVKHPGTHAEMSFEAPLAADISGAIEILRKAL